MIVCSAYSLNVVLPSPNCVDLGTMGVSIGWLYGIEEAGLTIDGVICGRLTGADF